MLHVRVGAVIMVWRRLSVCTGVCFVMTHVRMPDAGLDFAWHQKHAAFGTGTGLVLYHLRMHGAGVFDTYL